MLLLNEDSVKTPNDLSGKKITSSKLIRFGFLESSLTQFQLGVQLVGVKREKNGE